MIDSHGRLIGEEKDIALQKTNLYPIIEEEEEEMKINSFLEEERVCPACNDLVGKTYLRRHINQAIDKEKGMEVEEQVHAQFKEDYKKMLKAIRQFKSMIKKMEKIDMNLSHNYYFSARPEIVKFYTIKDILENW